MSELELNGGSRIYLVVSADDPEAAVTAIGRTSVLPDLCVKSPSTEARQTAEAAFGRRYVRTVDEPLLARRAPDETADDFAWRCADALRALYALDTRRALVIFDAYIGSRRTPIVLDERSLLRIAEAIERAVPVP